MALRRPWRDLDREAAAAAPDRYGLVEFGDESGSRGVDPAVLRDAVKEELAYGDATRVRWRPASSREHAERLAADHG